MNPRHYDDNRAREVKADIGIARSSMVFRMAERRELEAKRAKLERKWLWLAFPGWRSRVAAQAAAIRALDAAIDMLSREICECDRQILALQRQLTRLTGGWS